MTGGSAGAGASARREFAGLVLTGAAGAGLVLFCTRQPVARVIVFAPRPLPDSVVTLAFSDLRPAVAALAVAALASLAAVLATRRLLRRIVAAMTVALGTGMALLTAGRISDAEALAAVAARSAASPVTGSGAGSVTAGGGGGPAGGGPGPAGGPIAGLPARVLLEGGAWRWLLIAGAALIIAAAVTMAVRADRLPVMSSRYGPAGGRGRPGAARLGAAGDSAASVWDSLSAGADPTASPADDARAGPSTRGAVEPG